jgi:putative FmdB family regulatory protein
MPLYVYNCADCDLEMEVKRPIAEMDAPLECPVCGQQCERVLALGFGIGGRPASPEGGAIETGPGDPNRGFFKKLHRPGCPCC